MSLVNVTGGIDWCDPPRMYGDEPYVQQLGESKIASAPYALG